LKVVHAFGLWPHTAIGSNDIAHDITYDNLYVAGYNRGLVVAKAGYSIVNGGYYNNQHNIVVEIPQRQDRTVLIQGPIVFGQLPASRLTAPHYNIAMRSDFEPDRYGYIDHYFYNNTVTLNFGPYINQQLYFSSQAANAVPFPTAREGVPDDYIGLTTQQLWDYYGIALGGSVAPANATVVSALSNGLLGPA
jgi:hypothetical protein